MNNNQFINGQLILRPPPVFGGGGLISNHYCCTGQHRRDGFKQGVVIGREDGRLIGDMKQRVCF